MDESLSQERLTAIKARRDHDSRSLRELATHYWTVAALFHVTLGGTVAFYTY